MLESGWTYCDQSPPAASPPVTDAAPLQAAPLVRSGWTPERRARMSAMIKALQPWKKSTGPITAEGKSRSAQNGAVRGTRRGPRPEQNP